MANTSLKPPILLIGNGRSGTNMIRELFAQHTDIVDWDEPRTIWVHPDPGRPHDVFTAEDATAKAKHYIRRRFEKYQKQHGGRRIFEKTPSNTLRIPYIHAIFPESPIIYIIREPFAQISSSELLWRQLPHLNRLIARLRKTPKFQLPYYASRFFRDQFRKRILRKEHLSVWGIRYPGIYEDIKNLTTEQVIAKQWVACSQYADADLPAVDPSQVIRVRYEQFVQDPVTQFDRLAQHVGIAMTDELAAITSNKPSILTVRTSGEGSILTRSDYVCRSLRGKWTSKAMRYRKKGSLPGKSSR